jgi:phage I-like protein
MSDYFLKGKTLTADYEHLATWHWGKENVAPVVADNSAVEWVPEVRPDGLWATAVKWTEEAFEKIKAGKYRFFSPAFTHDAEGHIRAIINFALTNLPATWHQEPLVAASANGATNERDAEMAVDCPNCAENAAKLSAANARLSAYEDKERETKEQLSQLSSFQTRVFAVTGKPTPDESIGAASAYKSSHDRLIELEAQAARDKLTRLSADFSATLDRAVKEGKIAPPERALWEEDVKTDGLERAFARLSAFASVATPKVVTSETAFRQRTGGEAPTVERQAIRKQFGRA